MNKTKALQIITSNIMEGTGFISLFEQSKPDYKIDLQVFSGNTSNIENIYSDLTKSLKENSIVILDTDSLENSKLIDFLMILNSRNIKCIIYSRLSTPGLIIRARELLIGGYVSKSSPLTSLMDCLSVIELGGTYYDSNFSEILKEIMDYETILSLSERKLFHELLLFNNRSIKDLSDILNISKHTVEVHLSNLYKKANVKSYNELIERFSV